MVRMRDVAAMAGVSVTTVSHVVNNTRRVEPETQRRVLDAIATTGYRHNTLARALARGGTQSVGVALSATSNPYLADIVTAIEGRVSARGSMMLLGETHEDAEREYALVETLLTRRVDGVILAPGRRALTRTLPMLRDARVPTVLIDRLVADGEFDQVGSDNHEPVAAMVDHLVKHGHRRIALIAGLEGLPTTLERQHGYVTGLRRNGIPLRKELVADGGSHGDSAAAAAAGLWQLEDRPTAMITANNFMTVGVLTWLQHEGIRVPEDVALIGYDDFPWADLMRTPLTAVAQDWTTIGRRAVDMLFDRMEDPDRPPRSERIPVVLMRRASCGCTAPYADRMPT